MSTTSTHIEVAHKTIPFSGYLFRLILAVAIPLSLLSLGLATWGAKQRRTEALHGLVSTGRALQLAVDGELRTVAAELAALATAPELDATLRADPAVDVRAAFRVRATALVQQRPDVLLNFILIAPNGQQIVNTLAEPSAPLPVLDLAADRAGDIGSTALSERWSEILASPGVSLSPLFRDVVAHQQLVGVFLPIRRDGRVVGVLGAGLSPASLSHILRDAPLPDGWAAGLIDQNGTIITRSFNEAAAIGKQVAAEVLDFQRQDVSVDLVPTVRTMDGTLVYAALSRSSMGPWLVSYSVPRRLVDAPMWNSIGIAGVGGVLAIAIAVLGGRALGKQMRRDMRGLQVAAMALSQPGQDVMAPDTEAPRVREIALAHATFARTVEALRESEARLRLALDVTGLGVWEWDLHRLQARYDVVSSRLTQGRLPANQWLPLTAIEMQMWDSRIHPDDRTLRARAIDDVRQGRTSSYDVTLRVRGQQEDWSWLHMRGAIVSPGSGHLVGVVQDVTAQKDAEAQLERLVASRTAALAEAEARFRAIFNTQFQFTGLLTPDGTVLEANQTALDVGGLARNAVIGRPFWEIGWWKGADRPWLIEQIAAAARGAFIRHEITVLGAGGRELRLDFSLKPVRNATTGRVELIIPEGRDLSERHRLETQLAQAQKTQALGQLAGGIAHDFNNILQSVSASAGLLAHRPEDSARVGRLARVMLNAAERGASITGRLLSFARRGELRAERVAAGELLTDIAEVLAHTLGTPIVVRTEVAADVPPLFADRGQLETALVNLGTNARDAMPNGGTLILSVGFETVHDGPAHPALLKPGRYVRVTVRDDGVGMDAATLARVTEPFFTTKAEGRGTGLGLSMVKGFADQSGGGLTIESAPGQGTRVHLWLPAATDANARQEPADVPVRSERPVRVLLVDDDMVVRETLAAQLEEFGFLVQVAASGAEALAFLQVGEPVDVLISDLSMPDINGIETIRLARDRRPGLPCFLLTGYAEDGMALDRNAGFTLLRKPIGAHVLVREIENRVAAGPG